MFHPVSVLFQYGWPLAGTVTYVAGAPVAGGTDGSGRTRATIGLGDGS
jgi:hypothetical protein